MTGGAANAGEERKTDFDDDDVFYECATTCAGLSNQVTAADSQLITTSRPFAETAIVDPAR